MHTEYPVVVSIATVPSRICSLKRTLSSLLKGDLVPDQILVVHPEFCSLANSGYDIPEFFEDTEFCGDVIRRVVSPADWGPGTKMLGALDHVPHESYLVLADDDVVYDKTFLAGLVNRQRRDHRSSYSYHTYRANGLTFGQGCDGYSFWTPNLDGARAFVEEHVMGTTLLYHDDLWIAFYLFLHGITVRRIPLPENLRLIYEQIMPNNVLSSYSEGDLKRETITQYHLARLIAECPLRLSQLLTLRLFGAYDAINSLPRRAARRIYSFERRKSRV